MEDAVEFILPCMLYIHFDTCLIVHFSDRPLTLTMVLLGFKLSACSNKENDLSDYLLILYLQSDPFLWSHRIDEYFARRCNHEQDSYSISRCLHCCYLEEFIRL